jgi:hypothetical protein
VLVSLHRIHKLPNKIRLNRSQFKKVLGRIDHLSLMTQTALKMKKIRETHIDIHGPLLSNDRGDRQRTRPFHTAQKRGKMDTQTET